MVRTVEWCGGEDDGSDEDEGRGGEMQARRRGREEKDIENGMNGMELPNYPYGSHQNY